MKNLKSTDLFTSISAIAVALAGLTAAACTVDADNALFILHNQSPSNNCTVSTNKTDPFVSRGLLDSDGQGPYVFTPLVQSRTQALNSSDPLQRTVIIEGAEVNLLIPDGAADIGALEAAGALNFTQRFSGTIEPGALSTFIFDIIPPAVTQSIGANLTGNDTVLVLAEIEIFGELGNGSVTSPKFTYPISVCAGCVPINAPSCVNYVEPAAESCFPGQDNFAFECCVSAANQGALICPPIPESEPDPKI